MYSVLNRGGIKGGTDTGEIAALTDYISLEREDIPGREGPGGVAATGTASRRQRALPAHVMVYYVVASL